MTCLRKAMNVFIALALCSFAKDAPAIDTLKHIHTSPHSSYLWNISSSDSDSEPSYNARAKNKRKEHTRSDSSEKKKKSKSDLNHSASSSSHSGSDSSESESVAHSSDSDSSDTDGHKKKKHKHKLDSSSSSEESDGHSSDKDYEEADVEHFSQAGFPENAHNYRADHNETTIIRTISKLAPQIKQFQKSPTTENLTHLLQEIANIANVAYNETATGPNPGTWKHTLCKDFMNHIKAAHKNTPFDNVKAEYLTNDQQSRFDIVWLTKTTNNQKKAYVFDYKFGDENKNKSSSKDTQQYQQSLVKEGYALVGQIRDIKPTNNS